MKKMNIKGFITGFLLAGTVIVVSAYQTQIWAPIQYVKKIFLTSDGTNDLYKTKIVLDGERGIIKVNNQEVSTKNYVNYKANQVEISAKKYTDSKSKELHDAIKNIKLPECKKITHTKRIRDCSLFGGCRYVTRKYYTYDCPVKSNNIAYGAITNSKIAYGAISYYKLDSNLKRKIDSINYVSIDSCNFNNLNKLSIKDGKIVVCKRHDKNWYLAGTRKVNTGGWNPNGVYGGKSSFVHYDRTTIYRLCKRTLGAPGNNQGDWSGRIAYGGYSRALHDYRSKYTFDDKLNIKFHSAGRRLKKGRDNKCYFWTYYWEPYTLR